MRRCRARRSTRARRFRPPWCPARSVARRSRNRQPRGRRDRRSRCPVRAGRRSTVAARRRPGFGRPEPCRGWSRPPPCPRPRARGRRRPEREPSTDRTTGAGGGCRYDPPVAERGTRRFSQAISEGDGISVIVDVRDVDGARAAEAEGAEGIALRGALGGIREATERPILWLADGPPAEAASAGADACVVRAQDERAVELHGQALELGLDCVIRVANEEALEEALDQL